MCKRGDTFSLAILIGRGLDHFLGSYVYTISSSSLSTLFSFQGVNTFLELYNRITPFLLYFQMSIFVAMQNKVCYYIYNLKGWFTP